MTTLSPLSACAWLWIAWSIYWFVAARFVAKARFSEGLLGRLQHLLPIYFGFFLIFHGKIHGLVKGQWTHQLPVQYCGSAITTLGLLIAVWARLHLGRYWSGIITLKEGHRLIRTGPYRLVRHPVYTGLLIAVIGSATAVGTWDALIGVAVILLAFIFKLRREESLLTREFGEEYLAFKRETPALVPFLNIHRSRSTRSLEEASKLK